ncbi:uncharacterized [Tachysurus ichikawai]
MASAIHAVVCWGSRIKAADANRVKAELCYWGGTRLLGEGEGRVTEGAIGREEVKKMILSCFNVSDLYQSMPLADPCC